MTRKICSSTIRLLANTRLRFQGVGRYVRVFDRVGVGVAPLTPPLFKGHRGHLLVPTAAWRRAALLPSRGRRAACELRAQGRLAGPPSSQLTPLTSSGDHVEGGPEEALLSLSLQTRATLWSQHLRYIPGPVPEGPKHCRPEGHVRASRTTSNWAVLIHSRQPKNLKKEKYLESL